MTSGTVLNARRTERIPIMRDVELRTSGGRNFVALCTDVNQSGIGIDSDYMLRVGQKLTMHVTTHRGGEKAVAFLVIYRIGRHYGLCAIGSLEDVLELLPVNG